MVDGYSRLAAFVPGRAALAFPGIVAVVVFAFTLRPAGSSTPWPSSRPPPRRSCPPAITELIRDVFFWQSLQAAILVAVPIALVFNLFLKPLRRRLHHGGGQGLGVGLDAGQAAASPLVRQVRGAVIGDREVMGRAVWPRRIVYAATPPRAGRSPSSRTSSATRSCPLPRHHTELERLQTTRLREDARRIIRDAVGGDDEVAVLFCGSGSTGAMGEEAHQRPQPAHPRPTSTPRYRLSRRIPARRPVVFTGPFEHHSNELPWRESIAEVVVIREDADSHADLAQLEEELVRHAERHCGSGASQPPRTSPGSSPTPGRSRRCCTATAPCRSGTSPPPGRPSRSTCRAPTTTRWPTRTPSSCRRTSSSAAPAPPGCWWCGRAAPQPGADGPGRRHRRLRQRTPTPLLDDPVEREAAPQRSSSRSERPGSSSLSRRSG